MENKASTVLVDVKQNAYNNGEFIVQTIGEEKAYELATSIFDALNDKCQCIWKSYNLATGILDDLYDRHYCIWQAHTIDDIKAHLGVSDISPDELEEMQCNLESFDYVI